MRNLKEEEILGGVAFLKYAADELRDLRIKLLTDDCD